MQILPWAEGGGRILPKANFGDSQTESEGERRR